MGKILENYCIECNKKLASRYAKRCIFCAAKFRAKNPDYIKKLSDAKKGKKPNNNFLEVQKRAWEKNRGSKFTDVHKKKISDSHKGEKSYMWVKDRTQLIKRQERNDSAYCDWRLQVYKRDNYKCKINNQDCSGRIIAHHILGWSQFLELRYDINNGITLCLAHHPRKRAEEKQLSPFFMDLLPVSKV